jgi:hypothetical protein
MIVRLAVIIFLVKFLSGCIFSERVRDQAQVNPVVSYERSYSSAAPNSLIARCSTPEWIARAATGTACPLNPSGGSALRLEKLDTLSSNPETWRNSAQAELMTMSDLVCRKHTTSIYGTQASYNFLTSWFAAAMSGAAAIATDRAATNLAAGGALMGTTRGLMNSELYFSYVAPAVISEIDLIRAEARHRIQRKRVCSLNTYPAAEAINDALNYHEMCSFVVGLTSLLRKAGVEKQTGDPSAQVLRTNLARSIKSLNSEEAALQAQAADTALSASQRALARDMLSERRVRRGEIERLLMMLGPAELPEVERDVSLRAELALIDSAATATRDALKLASTDEAKKELTERLAGLALEKSELTATYAFNRRASINDLVNECVPQRDAPVPLPN